MDDDNGTLMGAHGYCTQVDYKEIPECPLVQCPDYFSLFYTM